MSRPETAQIEAILQPFRAEGLDAGCCHAQGYWQVWIGDHAGARPDGVTLAQDLAQKVRALPKARIVKHSPKPVEIPVFLRDPEADARAAELERRLAQAELALAAAAAPKPEEREPEGAFDASQLLDLVREDEPFAAAQDRWIRDYSDLTQRLVDPRLPPLDDDQRIYQRRLQAALYKARKGAVEIIQEQ
jgi:hypothetical protein